MKRAHVWLSAAIAGCWGLAACGPAGAPTPDPGTSGGDSSTTDSSGLSVGDVTTDGSLGTGEGALIDATRARVRNESAAQADVTVRFIHGNEVVHLAFVRVLPDTVTTVISPESAEVVKLSGVDTRGRALVEATLVFGVDFDARTPAEYRIAEDGSSGPAEGGTSPGRPEPTALRLIEPAEDVTALLGDALNIRWEDSSASPGAVVTLSFRRAGSEAGDLFAVTPAVGAALDGINDSIDAVVQGIEPGLYEIVGRIIDGDETETAIAPGRVEVLRDPLKAAPTIAITKPTELTELRDGGVLTVEWTDEDPDSNATMTFALVASDPSAVAGEDFVISPPIAEDPDGRRGDRANLVVRDVLPGLYDLVAVIDDGRLKGTDRVTGAVRVLRRPDNDPPQLEIVEPAGSVEVFAGGSLVVRWIDADANDDARITLLLDSDPDGTLLNGNEVVAAASLSEDGDGGADQTFLVVPVGTSPGVYRLVGVISDGAIQVQTQAPGMVTVRAAPAASGSGSGTGQGPGTGGGSVIGGDGDPPISDDGDGRPNQPVSTPHIARVDPAVDVVERPGEMVTVAVQTKGAPVIERVWVFLNNKAYGGDDRIDVTPATGPHPTARTFNFAVDTGLVPNDAWPRSFDIEIVTSVEGTSSTTFSSRPLWIFQEPEVLDLRMLNYTCRFGNEPLTDGTDFVGIEWTWYGGGLEEESPPADVEFWLTSDGGLLENDAEDQQHLLILRTAASPNKVLTSQAGLAAILGLEYHPTTRASGVIVTSGAARGLAPGTYKLVTVFDPAGAERRVYPVAVSLPPVEVCPPSLTAADD